MTLIRSLIVLIEMIIFAIGGMIIGMIIIPLVGVFHKDVKKRQVCSDIVRNTWIFFVKLLEKFGTIKLDIEGDFSNINQKVVVASHPCLLDIVFLISLIPNCVCLAKKAVLKNPCMRHIVKNIYIINDVELEEFLADTDKAIKDGFNIVIFPTGTRFLPNEEIKIHKGAAQIAINSNVDIVPITLKLDFPLLQKNHFPLSAGKKLITCKITRQNDIKISDYKNEEIDNIKLRKILSDKIKESILK